jgi:hypothetical protein
MSFNSYHTMSLLSTPNLHEVTCREYAACREYAEVLYQFYEICFIGRRGDICFNSTPKYTFKNIQGYRINKGVESTLFCSKSISLKHGRELFSHLSSLTLPWILSGRPHLLAPDNERAGRLGLSLSGQQCNN